jgi:hypothetical protein
VAGSNGSLVGINTTGLPITWARAHATIGAPITGDYGLVKLGGGTLALTGANTYAARRASSSERWL